MSEPTYFYVKGMGWLPGPEFETAETVLACGSRIRIEIRPPNKGELWDAGSPPDMESWIRILRSLSLSHLQLTPYKPHVHGPNVVTLIPL